MDTGQRIEMLTKIRELRGAGQPEKAAEIQEALEGNRYFLGGKHVAGEDQVKTPKKSASKEAWERYAKSVSDIDNEIVESLNRNDLIKMLKANGLIG